MIDPRLPVRCSAVLRIALGAAFIVKPQGGAVRPWIGDDAARPATTVLARALGIRDIVTAVVSLRTVDDPRLGPSWQRTLAVCDAVDLGATLAARRSLPKFGVASTIVQATILIVGQLWAAQYLASRAAADEHLRAG
jgi:hypothetical protein